MEKPCSVCLDLAVFSTVSPPDLETTVSGSLQTETHHRVAAQVQVVPREPVG